MKFPKFRSQLTVRLGLFLLFFIFITSNLEAQQKAFPSAYGGGAYSSGGRGGDVYHVTRIDDSFTNGKPTTGTFRWATEQARPATIVFDVSGIIELKRSLYIQDNDLTIAGQSAPQGGITITKKDPNIMFMLTKGSNIIMRYIRIRPQDVNDDDAFEFYSDTKGGVNTIFDHMSISYGSDEAFSIRGKDTRNITFQRGLIAESKTGSLFGDTDPGNGGKFSYDNSFFTTLFVNISHRTPNVAGNGRFDIVNNVVYNWNNRLSNIGSGAKVNHVNNYYFLGNKKNVSYKYNDGTTYYEMNCGNTSLNTLNIHTSGNIIQNFFTDANADNRAMWVRYDSGAQNELLPSHYFKDDMYALIGAKLPIMSAVEASRNVPADAGANKYLNADGTYGVHRDANDTDYVRMVQTDTPESYTVPNRGHSYIKGQRFANFVKAANSATAIHSRTDDFYVSNAHIPEAFFKKHVPAGQDHNDIAPSGYTWLEEYLNGVDKSQDEIQVGTIEISPSTGKLQISETLQLTAIFTPKNATNQDGTWNSTDSDIAKVDANGFLTAVSDGEVTITFKSADGGRMGTALITVFSKALQASAGIDQQICEGDSATLRASGGKTYLWSTGETTSSITVSPITTMTYSVIAYDGSGENSKVDEVTVTVNPLPMVSAGQAITINSGEVVKLTGTGASSYKWSTGATTASIEVRPAATKTYTVTGTKNACEATATVKVTVRTTTAVKANAGEDQTICAGTNATLTATGGKTYLWSTGETTSSISVSPVIKTEYSVTAYDSTGKNSATDEVTVNVNPLPIVTAGTDVTINSGESTTLTASGAVSYKWNTGATTASIEVRPTATKTYNVMGIKNGCEASASIKVTVINVTKVKANAGMDVRICKGNYTTLTASGADTYLWSTGATTASIDVNPTSTVSYSVTAHQGDASDSDEVVVFVSADPNVSILNGEEATILKGEYITLSASGASKYKWSNGATKPNIAVSPKETQTYSVTGYINECSAERSIKINVLEKIKAYAGQDVTMCVSERTVLTAEGPANSEFLWSTGEVTKTITVSPTEETEYSVMVYNELDADTAKVLVSVENCRDTEIIEQTTDLEFLIHPNPTYGEIHIKISGMTNLSSIHLYDISGKSLYNETINEGEQQRYNKTLDLSDYAAGIYLLQLVDNETVITKKVILK